MTSASVGAAGRWFRWLCRSDRPRIRLFCFPHAGGTAGAYRNWPRSMPAEVDVLAARYPAREDRFNDPVPASMEDLVGELVTAMAPLCAGPVALFGHSMGSWISWEVARRLSVAPDVQLRLLLVSGQVAPHLVNPARYRFDTDEQLLDRLRQLGGTAEEVVAHPAIRQLVLPSLRGDYRLLRGYTPQPGAAPGRVGRLDVPVHAYGGDQDREVPEAGLAAWRSVTAGAFRHRMFPGGHFYLDDPDIRRDLLADVAARLFDAARSPVGAGPGGVDVDRPATS